MHSRRMYEPLRRRDLVKYIARYSKVFRIFSLSTSYVTCKHSNVTLCQKDTCNDASPVSVTVTKPFFRILHKWIGSTSMNSAPKGLVNKKANVLLVLGASEACFR